MNKIENIAKYINPNSIETISIEQIDSDTFEVTAMQKVKSETRIIKMEFSRNGFAALVGSMRAIEELY